MYPNTKKAEYIYFPVDFKSSRGLKAVRHFAVTLMLELCYIIGHQHLAGRKSYPTQSSWLTALLSASWSMKTENGQDNKVCTTENHGDDDGRGWIAVRKVIISGNI